MLNRPEPNTNVAPQVFAGGITEAGMLGVCGVIMYAVLCGYPPVFCPSDAQVLAEACSGNFSFNLDDWLNVSEDAMNLISVLLQDHDAAEQALDHGSIGNKAHMATKA